MAPFDPPVVRPWPHLVGVGLVEHQGVRVRQHARRQVAVEVERDHDGRGRADDRPHALQQRLAIGGKVIKY